MRIPSAALLAAQIVTAAAAVVCVFALDQMAAGFLLLAATVFFTTALSVRHAARRYSAGLHDGQWRERVYVMGSLAEAMRDGAQPADWAASYATRCAAHAVYDGHPVQVHGDEPEENHHR